MSRCAATPLSPLAFLAFVTAKRSSQAYTKQLGCLQKESAAAAASAVNDGRDKEVCCSHCHSMPQPLI